MPEYNISEAINKLPTDVIDAIGEIYRPFIPTIIGECPICNKFVMSNQSHDLTMTRQEIKVLHAECKLNESSISQVQFLDKMMSQRDESIRTLKKIAGYMGQTYYDDDPTYEAGFNSGRDSMAELAQDALATIEAIGKVK